MKDFLRDLNRLHEWSNGVLDEIEAGRLDAAERLCEKLRQHYPERIDGHKRLAAVREAQGRWAEAISAYDRSLEHIQLHPDGYDHEMVEHLQEMRERARQHLGTTI